MNNAPRFMLDEEEVYFSEYVEFVEKNHIHYPTYLLEAISLYLYEVQKMEYIDLNTELLYFLLGHIEYADDQINAIEMTEYSGQLLNPGMFKDTGNYPYYNHRLLKQFGWFSGKYDFDLDFEVYFRIKP